MSNLGDLKPQTVWQYFEKVLTIPRPSNKEDKIVEYLLEFSKKHGLEAKKDKAGNVLISKQAQPGFEQLKTVVLQSHVDMVCEKNADITHDFEKDPIRAKIIDGWVKAEGTTLGADNGIGVAAQLAVLASKEIAHGPLECLFTVGEETGLTGAFGLEENFFSGEILINLDSEDDGEVFMGCAGGVDTLASIRFNKKRVPTYSTAYQIKVSGLQGGHSGDDIEKELGNSIKILTRFLWMASKKYGIRVGKLTGGNLRNAIPREAEAVVTVKENFAENFICLLAGFTAEIKNEYVISDPKVTIEFKSCALPNYVINKKAQFRLLNSLHACPHGIIAMSTRMDNLVETSTNLAAVKMNDHEFLVTTSQRSSIDSRKQYIANTVRAVFESVDAEVKHTDGYPGWKPNTDSEILRITEKAYQKTVSIDPAVKAIHAGLECGLFLLKYPHLDMVSIGPTIKGAHSPDERMEIATVARFWDALLEILKNIPKK